jgi:hypothetical protein
MDLHGISCPKRLPVRSSAYPALFSDEGIQRPDFQNENNLARDSLSLRTDVEPFLEML